MHILSDESSSPVASCVTISRISRSSGNCQFVKASVFRTNAGPDAYFELLLKVSPTGVSLDLAARVHERVRHLRGRWKAAPYGGEMDYIGRSSRRDASEVWFADKIDVAKPSS